MSHFIKIETKSNTFILSTLNFIFQFLLRLGYHAVHAKVTLKNNQSGVFKRKTPAQVFLCEFWNFFYEARTWSVRNKSFSEKTTKMMPPNMGKLNTASQFSEGKLPFPWVFLPRKISNLLMMLNRDLVIANFEKKLLKKSSSLVITRQIYFLFVEDSVWNITFKVLFLNCSLKRYWNWIA